MSSSQPLDRTRGDLGAEPAASDQSVVWLVRAGSRLVTLGLVATAFSGNWANLGVPGPLDRALFLTGFVALLVGGVTERRRLVLRPVHVAMLVGVLQVLVSIAVVQPYDGAQVFALVDRYGVLPFVLFAIAPLAYGTPENRRFFARVFTIWCVYLGVVSLTQTLGMDALVWPRYILNPDIGLHADRARGPYVEAVAHGMMLCFSGAMAGLTFFTDPRRAWRRLALVGLGMAGVGVLLTLTRTIWLGAFLAVLACALIPRLRGYVVGGALVAIGLVLVALVAVPGLTSRVTERADERSPLYDRLNTNAAALRMWETHPLFGVGWHHAGERMVDYIRQGADYPVTSASVGLEVHNVFLARLAELGMVGTLVWLCVLGGVLVFPLVRRAETSELQAWRCALLPIAVIWVVAAMFGPVPYPQPNYFLYAVGGIVLVRYLQAVPSPVFRGVESRSPAGSAGRRLGRGPGRTRPRPLARRPGPPR